MSYVFLLKVKTVKFHYFCITFFKVLLRNSVIGISAYVGFINSAYKPGLLLVRVSGCGCIDGDYCFLCLQHLIFKTL